MINKKSQTKTIGILSLFILLFTFLVYATSYSNQTSDDIYDLDGTDITISTTVTPTSGTNISNISLWTDATGTWTNNQTISYSGASLTDTSRAVSFIFNSVGNASIPDGTDIKWSIEVGLNGSNSTQGTSFSTNRTVNVEFPPDIDLTYPADNNWEIVASSTLNYSIVSPYSSGTAYSCQLLTNETGSWLVQATVTGNNGTNNSVGRQFPDDLSYIEWGVRCFETTDANVFNSSINRTVKVDRTNPIPTISQINNEDVVNNSYISTNSLNINYSVTESNPTNCSLYINSKFNATDQSGGNVGNFTVQAIDGTYTARVGCSDVGGNFVNESTIYTFTLDTVAPSITGVGNSSVNGESDDRFFDFSANEEVNATLWYGSTTDTSTSNLDNSGMHTTINFTIKPFEEDTVYYWNITACDRAGNCAGSGQFSFTFPWKLLYGWSYYGIFEGRINFSTILNQTDSEWVYYWNQTGQNWVYATAGGTTDMEFEVGTNVADAHYVGRHVVAIYEETNSTWERNTTNTGAYNYNFTTGDNFIKLSRDYSFGNLSLSLFNGSLEYDDKSNTDAGINFGREELQLDNGFDYKMTEFWFSAYNNSGVTWEPYYVYNFTSENNTALTVPSKHEVVWIFSEKNMTWNATNMLINWTI